MPENITNNNYEDMDEAEQQTAPHNVADGRKKSKSNKNINFTNAATSKGTKRKSKNAPESIQDKKAKVPPAEMTKTSNHEAASKEHGNQEVDSPKAKEKKLQQFKYSDGLEPKKLFVKGLPNDAAKEEVEQIFGAFGKLTDVRLVNHKSGFKNFAYIEFEDEKAAKKAVKRVDQMELRDHTISVAISAPPPKPKLGLNPKRIKLIQESTAANDS